MGNGAHAARRSTSFDGLLPSEVVVVEAQAPVMWETGLFPEELALMGRAVDKRVREFTAGRNCARQAMARLGLPPAPIGVGTHREPLFAKGVLGSITHTHDYCAAALTCATHLFSVGIDAESNRALEDDVAVLIGRPDELQLLSDGLPPECHAGALAFGLKESFFKAVFPLCRRYLEFFDVRVELEPMPGEANFVLQHPELSHSLQGFDVVARYGFDARHVYSAVVLSRRSA